jgi:uncharacterized protein DUF3108
MRRENGPSARAAMPSGSTLLLISMLAGQVGRVDGTAQTATAKPSATAAASPGDAQPPFAPGEEIDVVIEYLHVRTGRARFIVGRPEGAVWPIVCQGRSDGIAGLLDIREHYVAYWDAERHVSRGSDLNAIEMGDRHTDRARFDRANGKVFVQVIRKGRVHQSARDVPNDVHDLASVLLTLRLKPLRPGDRYELPVFSGTQVFTLRAEVEGNETLETPAGRFDTTRLKVQLGFKDQFRTRRDAHVWFSRDARRIPVRMSADFAVGSVVVTVSGYHPGGPLAASR